MAKTITFAPPKKKKKKKNLNTLSAAQPDLAADEPRERRVVREEGLDLVLEVQLRADEVEVRRPVDAVGAVLGVEDEGREVLLHLSST